MFSIFRDPTREPILKSRPTRAVPHHSFSELLGTIVLPWFMCVAICYMFAMIYHFEPMTVWLVILASLVTCMSMIQHDPQLEKTQSGLWDSSMVHLCLVAIVLATVFGSVAYRSFYSRYWLSHNSHAYANVLPSEAAGPYADAGKLIFSEDARLVVSKALGYKEGSVYCVAPIQDDSDSTVQFWAAGLDCCGARGSFSCDDAWDIKAHSGVVLMPEPGYVQAVHQAQAAFGLEAVKQPVFVRWVVNPEIVELKDFLFGNGLLVGVCIVFLVLLALFGTGLDSNQRNYYAERIGLV